MREQDEQFIKRALALAKYAEKNGEVPVGAVIVKDQRIIAEGCNQPIQSHDPTAHAEIIALRAASETVNNYRLNNTTLYVTLEPCTMCVGAILHARIERLVFGAWDKKAGAVHSVFQLLDDPRHNHTMTWRGGVLADECSALLTDFFASRRG